MPKVINLSPYVNPGNPLPGVDIAAGMRWLGEQNLQRERMAQQQSQFDTTEGRANREHTDEVTHQKAIESDINSRFAIEQQQHTRDKQIGEQLDRSNKANALTAKAREAVASGRLNEAESYLGTLSDLGVHVSKTMNPDGTPNYRFENPHEHIQYGESFDSMMNRINGQRDHSVQQPVPTEEQKTPQQNPYDVLPGANAASIPQQTAAPGNSQEQPHDEMAGIGYDSANDTNQPQTPMTTAGQPQSGAQFDPYTMNTGSLREMNEKRLDPVLQGIASSFPNRFQNQISPFLSSVRSLGMSPELTLNEMQKPLDTISRLYGAELNAEGQMGRAAVSQGGQASTEARLREESAYKRAEQKAKDIGLIDDNTAYYEIESIKDKLNSGNPNLQADAVKQLIALREGHRITDKDFEIGLNGIASNIDQLKASVQGIYQSGLKDFQIYRFNQMMDVTKKTTEDRIRIKSRVIHSLKSAHRYEPERHGVDLLLQTLPPQFWTPEQSNFDSQADAGGRAVRTPPNRRSATVSGPNTQQNVQGVQQLEGQGDELDEYLR